ncbi:MAG: alginate lyase family protein [Pseudomonadota bacterium]
MERVAGRSKSLIFSVLGVEEEKTDRPLVKPHDYVVPCRDTLRAAYFRSPAYNMADTFVLYRILGNDLPPRHTAGQTLENLKFILENEPDFEGCEKRFLLNRPTDPEQEHSIKGILDAHGMAYTVIPFDPIEYQKTDWSVDAFPTEDYIFSNAFKALEPGRADVAYGQLRRDKNLYAMNNNAARNFALKEGRTLAKWVLPFDGSCAFSADGFSALKKAVLEEPWYPYFVIPMVRLTANASLPGSRPKVSETSEPQVVFRCDAEEQFDETVPYGRRPKVDLFWRLGVRGIWDRYRNEVWDLPFPQASAQIGWYKSAAWVARLASGRADIEVGKKALQAISRARGDAVVAFLDGLDGQRYSGTYKRDDLVLYDDGKIAGLSGERSAVSAAVLQAADEALARAVPSVLDKTGCAPSGDRHDYFSQAPYWWPDPSQKDGLPYTRRDGNRLPGTGLYETGSNAFDRSAFQTCCEDNLALCLAGRAFGQPQYLEAAAQRIRAWFLDAGTAMNPNLTFSQVRLGSNGDAGHGSGIVEFRGLVRILDSVRILTAANALKDHEVQAFRRWVSEYLNWLQISPQGRDACHAPHNVGTHYDLQLASAARFLGDDVVLAKARNWARLRLSAQIAADGSLRHELDRTNAAHYVVFALASWAKLARVFDGTGDNLWSWRSKRGLGLPDAFRWLANTVSKAQADATFQQEVGSQPTALLDFSQFNLAPLWMECHRSGLVPEAPQVDWSTVDPRAEDLVGVLPYWQLAR